MQNKIFYFRDHQIVIIDRNQTSWINHVNSGKFKDN